MPRNTILTNLNKTYMADGESFFERALQITQPQPDNSQNVRTSGRPDDLNWPAVMLLPVPVWIFFGNLSVLVVISEHQNLRRVWSNKIIFSLALTDMMISVVVMPFAAMGQLCSNHWPFNFELCAFHIVSDVYFCSSSILHLLLIAVNRYAAIGWPITYRRINMTARYHYLFLAGVWGFPLLIVAPLVIYVSYYNEGIFKDEQCEIFYTTFILYGSISVFYFPLIIMLAVDIRSFYLLKAQQKTKRRLQAPTVHEGIQQMASSATSERPTTRKVSRLKALAVQPRQRDRAKSATNGKLGLRRDSEASRSFDNGNTSSATSSPPLGKNRNNKNSTHHSSNLSLAEFGHTFLDPIKRFIHKQRAEAALLTVFIVFVICWLPFFTINILQTFIDSVKQQKTLFLIFVWLGYCSSGFNPIIYPLFNSEYRKCFMRTFSNREASMPPSRSVSVSTTVLKSVMRNAKLRAQSEPQIRLQLRQENGQDVAITVDDSVDDSDVHEESQLNGQHKQCPKVEANNSLLAKSNLDDCDETRVDEISV